MNAVRKNIKYITGLVAILLMLSIAFMSSNVQAEENSSVSTRTQTVENNEEIVRFDYKSDAVNVLVTLTNSADLPENAELSVTPVAITEDMQDCLDQEAINKQKAIESAAAFDIKFLVDGQEVQPGNTVRVQVTLPDITADTDADVYHFDETAKAAEDMNAAVSPEGQVEFDTTHFSTYIIVNTNNDPITVTIQHYNNSKQPIYAADTRYLQPGDRINDYKKAVNWNVDKVVKIDENGNENEIADKENIMLAKNTTLRVYYSPKSGQTTGDTTFFDYLVKPQTASGKVLIDQSVNYEKNYDKDALWNVNAKNKNTINDKKHRFSVGINNNYENFPVNQYQGFVNEKGNNINGWTGNSSVIPGIVTGLSGGEDGYRDVNFNYNFYTPDLFSMNEIENSIGKKVIDDYKLVFSQKGDTLTLTQVNDQDGNIAAKNMNQFFPLDALMSAQKNGNKNTIYEYNGESVYDAFDGNSWSTYGHNYYFGMRYDIEFTLNDYIGELNYKFTGDDDLWVILDGKQVVIDLGGIHNAATGKANLWDYIKDADGNSIAQNGEGRTEAQKSQMHRLTVLYMERGGNVSNCQMNFTIPNAQIVDVTPAPKANLEFTKINMQGEPLSGASFKLSNDSTELTATSDGNGHVSFQGLKVGEYTLVESAAPDGYTASSEIWKVKVIADSEGKTAVATLYQSDGTTPVEKNQIVNYTSQELLEKDLEYSKTAHVTNWDDRTYKIEINAKSKATIITQSADISNVQIQDTIDPRFELIQGEKTRLEKEGAEVNVNDDGSTTVVWNNQTVTKEGMTKTINIVAKSDYLGDNAVETNTEDSFIFSGSSPIGRVPLGKPTVNVKVNLGSLSAEDTIFWGENRQLMQSDEAFKQAWVDKVLSQYHFPENYKIIPENITLSWPTGEQYPEIPDKDTTYPLTLTYTPQNATNDSNKNTTLLDGTVKNVDVPTTAEANYTIHVVKGQLEITKTIDDQYTNIKQINANQTFVFKIERYEVGEDGNKGQLAETFYETINFNANETGTEKTKLVSGLKKGYYTVTEETNWSQKYMLDKKMDNFEGNQEETADLLIGKHLKEAANNNRKPEFYGLDETKLKDSSGAELPAAQQYSHFAEGSKATVEFTNKLNTNWKWLSDTAAAVNVFDGHAQ